ALALPAAAQAPAGPVAVKVGDPAVDGSFIKPYKNRWTVTLYTPDGKSVDGGYWTDEVEVVDDHGRSLLKRTQFEKLRRRTVTTVTLVDQRPGAPVMPDIREAGGSHAHIESAGTGVKPDQGGVMPGDPPQPPGKAELQLAMPVYDFLGGIYG